MRPTKRGVSWVIPPRKILRSSLMRCKRKRLAFSPSEIDLIRDRIKRLEDSLT